jgi:hypothetical protein
MILRGTRLPDCLADKTEACPPKRNAGGIRRASDGERKLGGTRQKIRRAPDGEGKTPGHTAEACPPKRNAGGIRRAPVCGKKENSGAYDGR